MAVPLSELKTELQTDPNGLGYAPLTSSGQTKATADLINTVQSTAAYLVFFPTVTSYAVHAAFDPTEFATLAALSLNQLSVMLSGGLVNSASSSTRTILLNIFTGMPTTRGNLAAVMRRQGSRAEVLWGIGTIVMQDEVERALRS